MQYCVQSEDFFKGDSMGKVVVVFEATSLPDAIRKVADMVEQGRLPSQRTEDQLLDYEQRITIGPDVPVQSAGERQEDTRVPIALSGHDVSILTQLAECPTSSRARELVGELAPQAQGIGRAILGDTDVRAEEKQAADGCLQWAAENREFKPAFGKGPIQRDTDTW